MATLNKGYISIGKAALMLDLSTQTIARWYKWWENDNFEHPENMYLPEYYFKDRKRVKYFKEEDLVHLEKFHKQLTTEHRGVMADFNAAYQWGKRGERILQKRNTSSREVKAKFD